MDNLLDVIESFFSMIEARFAIATVVMIIIFVVICFLLFLILTSFQNRRDAVGVELPDINDHGEVVTDKSIFQEDEELTIELIDPEDDTVVNDDGEQNDDVFFAALTMETKTLVLPDSHSGISMPEMTAIEAERKILEHAHLREIAKADSEENLINLESPSENEESHNVEEISVEDNADESERVENEKHD